MGRVRGQAGLGPEQGPECLETPSIWIKGLDYVSDLLRFVFGSFFRHHLFSTTWPGSFWVRFFHSYVFSTTSRLRFWVRLGSFLGHFTLFSTTSRVRFQKKVF
ncbi:MAG TPA: hypothetical protein VNM47_12705, partial [Terriglobia bacterium]|nr:hypothetical protein [Terriglobia bacterium]